MGNRIVNRDSNMELARIVAMAMILVGHFIFHGLQQGMPLPDELPIMGVTEISLMSLWALCMPGTDLFILISGFYGIKLTWKRIVSYWLLCVFYNSISLFANVPISDINFSQAIDVLFISPTWNWFFRAYFWLMLASPVLNKALKEFDVNALRILSAIGVFLICVSSWKFSNPKGDSPLLLMVLYFVGGYLRKEPVIQKIPRGMTLGAYLSMVVATIGSGIFVYDVLHKQYGIMLQRNCIFVIIMSVSLFLFFRTMRFRSKTINIWASTVVAALFIQDVIFRVPLYEFFHSLFLSEGLSVRVCLAVIIGVIATFVAAFIVEWPRKKVADKLAESISTKLDKILDLGQKLNR